MLSSGGHLSWAFSLLILLGVISSSSTRLRDGLSHSGLCVLTALQVMISPTTVKEGQSVTLTCSATCRLSNNPTYIWYKNGLPVSTALTFGNNTFSINKVSISDAGQYSCAVTGHEGQPSDTVGLSVRYAPRNTTALLGFSVNEETSVRVTCSQSTSPLLSLSLKEGTSVILSCSSDANPPVHSYVWYKKSGADTFLIASRQNYSITAARVKDSGQYYCKAENKIGITMSTLLPLHVNKVYTGLRSVVLIPAIIVVAIAVGFVCWWRRAAERASRVHSKDLQDWTETTL